MAIRIVSFIDRVFYMLRIILISLFFLKKLNLSLPRILLKGRAGIMVYFVIEHVEV